MYILQDKNLQDKLSTTGWARDWVWSVAYAMIQKFGMDKNVRLIPPSVEAWSKQWYTYRSQIADTLMELLLQLAFHDIHEEWQWKMVEKHHPSPQEWGGNMDFCWNFMRPKDSVIEALLCLFSFNLNKYGTYDYEFLGFTHNDIDQLFHWQRDIQ